MLGSQIEALRSSDDASSGNPREARATFKSRVLVVENEKFLRDSLGRLLNESGYEVSFADHGRDALRLLHCETLPDLIILDLKMPVMDGWEFRTIQKDDPKLGLIPVLAVSGDMSPKAAAISAQGYLSKPFDSEEVMTAVERVLGENEARIAARLDETERLTSLGRLAANVGHEINNPLTYVMLNLRQSLDELRAALDPLQALQRQWNGVAAEQIKTHIANVTEMLEECAMGGERIRETVANLQQLSQKPAAHFSRLDLQKVIEESVSMAWNQIRHRAHLTKSFGDMAPVRGNRTAIGQVFLNLLVNAAHSIPEGDAEGNEIRIASKIEAGARGAELVVEIRDSGTGIAPELLPRVFEPYFTTKPLGEGMGLGLSISRQTINDHGGRLTVQSEVGQGTTFRVALPVDGDAVPGTSLAKPVGLATPPRGRILVIDDEPLIGRVIQGALKGEHDVVFVQRAAEALARLAEDATYDMVLCDLVMPDLNGAEFYARVAERWPHLVTRLVFMTGGAFTPGTIEFMKDVPTEIIAKPFALDELRQRVRAHVARAN